MQTLGETIQSLIMDVQVEDSNAYKGYSDGMKLSMVIYLLDEILNDRHANSKLDFVRYLIKEYSDRLHERVDIEPLAREYASKQAGLEAEELMPFPF